MPENKSLIDAAREFFIKANGGYDLDFHDIPIEVTAAFAEQQIALAVAEAVKVERERLYQSFEEAVDFSDRDLHISVKAWIETEFSKEIQANG